MATMQCFCSECGKSFEKLEAEVKRSKTGNHFCSNLCSNLNRAKIRLQKFEDIRKAYELNPTRCYVCQSPLYWDQRHNKFCSHSCSAKMTNSERPPMSEDQRMKLSIVLKRRFPPKITEKCCPVCKLFFTVGRTNRHKIFCSRNCSNVGRDLSNNGGYREKGGRGKQGWYKGFYCQSLWELAWVIYSLEHNIKFVRNTEGFEYEFENKKFNYYPDFLMEDGSYTEIKGYNSKQWEAKKTQFPRKLSIIGKDEIKPYINYVVEKYGKDFVRLYE